MVVTFSQGFVKILKKKCSKIEAKHIVKILMKTKSSASDIVTQANLA